MQSRIFAFVAAMLLTTVATSAALGDEGRQFSDTEISVIREYFHDHDERGADRKRKGLPPGIAKNLRRGKPLPPGIAKRALPAGLVARLPAPPRGYERIIVDGKVLLVEVATQVVHDILVDVLLR